MAVHHNMQPPVTCGFAERAGVALTWNWGVCNRNRGFAYGSVKAVKAEHTDED
jgi:hypothetical protein